MRRALNPRNNAVTGAGAALFQKVMIETAELLVEQAVGLVDQADDNARDAAAFGAVFVAAAGGLHHLVVGAAAWGDVAVAEAHGDIVAKLGDLEALQTPVTAMFRD